MNRQWLQVTLGIMTAIGGFLDAGTIASVGQAGAEFGLGIVWALLIATLAAILLLDMTGRLAAVSKKGYAAAIREHFGIPFYLITLTSEVIAETILLGAEIGGVAIALSLGTGYDWRWLLPVAALLVAVMIWWAPFSLIENGPALLGLTTLAFVVGVVVLGGPSRHLMTTIWHPSLSGGKSVEYFGLVAATIGSTISPYLLFFYSSGAREEHWTIASLQLNRMTAIVGMVFGCVSALALILLGAIVLQPLNIGGTTLGEVGLGLASPLGRAGALLFVVILFACCLGASLEVSLALGYNVAQGFGWDWGIDKKPAATARFRTFVLVLLVIATGLGLVVGDPLKLAVQASIILALFLPFSLSPLLIIMNDADYLGDKTNNRFVNVATILVIALAFIVAAVTLPVTLLGGGG